jgi:hypothetical protein
MVFHSVQLNSESAHLSSISRIVYYAGRDKHSSTFRRAYPSRSIICHFASKPFLIFHVWSLELSIEGSWVRGD